MLITLQAKNQKLNPPKRQQRTKTFISMDFSSFLYTVFPEMINMAILLPTQKANYHSFWETQGRSIEVFWKRVTDTH